MAGVLTSAVQVVAQQGRYDASLIPACAGG